MAANSPLDYAAIIRFSLSTLRNMNHLLDSEEQFRFHTSAARAMATIRRPRGSPLKAIVIVWDLHADRPPTKRCMFEVPMSGGFLDIHEQNGTAYFAFPGVNVQERRFESIT